MTMERSPDVEGYGVYVGRKGESNFLRTLTVSRNLRRFASLYFSSRLSAFFPAKEPSNWNKKKRCEENSEQGIHPDEGDVEGNQSCPYP